MEQVFSIKKNILNGLCLIKNIYLMLILLGGMLALNAHAQTTVTGASGFGWKTTALPDGRIVVSQHTQTEIKVFNPNGTLYGSFRPCNSPCKIAAIGATFDGNIVVGITHMPDYNYTFSRIPEARVYSGATFAYISGLAFPYPVTGDLAAIAVSPQWGGSIAVSVFGNNQKGEIFIFSSNYAFSKYLHKPSTYAIEDDWFGRAIAASRTGDFAASYRYKNPAAPSPQTAVGVFNLNNGSGNYLYFKHVIQNPGFYGNGNPLLAVDLRGNLLVADSSARVSTYRVGKLFVYSLANAQLLQEIVNPIEHNSSPYGIDIVSSPMSNHVLISGYDYQRSASVVYVYTGQTLLGQVSTITTPARAYSMAVSPTGGLALGLFENNSVQIFQNYFAPPPVIQQFYADPATLIRGNNGLLKWQVSGATSVSISPTVTVPAGATSVSVSPTATTTYTLTASNPSGNVSRALTLTVKEPDYDNDGMPDPWETANGLNISVNDAALDLDSDGLSNIAEFTAGTKPNLADTDGDGMFDGYEVQHTLNPLSADHLADPDADGLNNLNEFLARTSPKNIDTDNDGLSDRYEVDNGLNPLVADATADADSDGLTNLKEFQSNTNPKNPDTDSDGMLDGYEVTHGLGPLVADSGLDSDSDGLTNLVEHNLGTNPKNKDTDNDGIPDAFEVAVGLNPIALADGAADLDGDGVSNYYEYLAGTDLNLNTDYPLPQTVTTFSSLDLPCESANCYALVSWNISQYSTACVFDQTGAKQVCAASGSIKVLKDSLYQKNYKILEYPVASSRELATVAINNSRVNSWGRITPASNGPCTINGSTGECIKSTSINYSRKSGEQHVTMWRVNQSTGAREEVQRLYNGAVFENYSLMAPNQKGYVYEMREGITSSGQLLHSYVSWKNEKATPPPALNATPQNCSINEEHETCTVQVHWDKASMGNAAQYCLMNGTELIKCTADNFVNVTVGIRPIHLQLRTTNSVNVNVLSDVFIKAVVSASFKLNAPSCVPTYGNTCLTSVSWSAQDSSNPCLYKDGQLMVCAKAGHLEIPVSTSGTTFSLRNGSVYSSSVELTNKLAKVEDNWLSLSNDSCDIRYPDTQCRINVSWAVRPTESACVYQNNDELFCGVNGNNEVLLNPGVHEFTLRQNGSVVRTMATNVKVLPWGKLTFPAFTKYGETVQRAGGKQCLLAPGQTYCTVRMDAIFQHVSRSNYVTLWRKHEGQWQLFNKKSIGELINGVFQNEYDFVTSQSHEYRLTWRADGSTPTPNDLLLDQAIVSGVAAPAYEYILKAPKNYCYYAEGDTSCKVKVSWSTDDTRFTSLCVTGQGISGLPQCKPSSITAGKWQGDIEVDVPLTGRKLLLRDNNLSLTYRELDLYAIKGLDFINVSECSYATGVCAVTVIWNATAAKNCIYSENLSTPVACTNNANGNGMVTFDVTDTTGGEFYLAADTDGVIEKLTSFSVEFDNPVFVTPEVVNQFDVTTDVTNKNFVLSWSSLAGKTYQLEYRGSALLETLFYENWLPIQGVLSGGETHAFSMQSVAAFTYLQWRIRSCNAQGDCSSWQQSRIKANHINTSDSSLSLLAPADNAVVTNANGGNICFSWIPDANAKLHNLTISDTREFTDKRWLKTVSGQQEACWSGGNGWSKAGLYSGELSQSLEYGKTYYWRIAVMNHDDSFSFSQIRQFVLRKDSPTINVSADLYTKTFAISWDDLSAASYQLEYHGAATEEALAAAAWQAETSYNNTGRHTQVSMQVRASFRYLQWRVRACNQSMSCTTWTSSNIKVNQNTAKFSNVQLVSPELNQVINTGGSYNQPCFNWTADPQATDYVITVSTTSEFPDRRWTRWTGASTEVCWDDEKGWQREGIYSSELPQSLNKQGGVYYWRVVSVYADDTIAFSPMGMFAVNDFADPIAVLLSPLPKNTNSIKMGKTLPLQMTVYDRFMRAWKTAEGKPPLISYYVNGSLQNDTQKNAGEIVYWDPPAIGRYEIYAVANLQDGRILESQHAYVDVVDPITPTVNLSITGSLVEARPVYLSAVIDDPDLQLVSVTFRANGEQIGAQVMKPPYSITWMPAAPGNYQLDVVVSDLSGKEIYSAQKTVLVNAIDIGVDVINGVSDLVEVANQGLRLFGMNQADALIVQTPNNSRISYNKFSKLLLNRPLKIINRADMYDGGEVPQLIVLDADQLELNSSIEIIGEPADLLIVNASASNSIRCKNCGFTNVQRATFAVVTPATVLSAAMTHVGELQTRGGGVVDIDNLQASGVVSLEIIADKVAAKGHINTQQYANQSSEINSQSGTAQVLDFVAKPNENSVVVSSGGFSLLQGNLRVNYETMALESTVAGAGVMDLQANIASGAINIFATDAIQLSGNLSTRSSHRAAQIYRGQLRAQEEHIQLKTIAQEATAPSLRISGSVLSDAKVSVIGHSSEIKSTGGIQANAVKAELIGSLVNRGYIRGYVRATTDHAANGDAMIELGAGSVDNRGEIRGVLNDLRSITGATSIDGKINIVSEGDVYNRFGGVISANTINVFAKGKIRNGSLFAFDGSLPNGKESTTAISLAPHDTHTLSTHKTLSFSLGEPPLKNTTASILGGEVTLEAKQSIENINPYTEPYTSASVEISAMSDNAEAHANDVQIEATRKLQIFSDTYLLNSSARLGVSQAGATHLLSIKVPTIRNERYYSNIITEGFNDAEVVKSQTNATITTWVNGVQSRYGFYSPPGYIYSFAEAQLDFGPTGDGLLNNISFVDLYGDLKVFGQGKITTRGISLEKMAYDAGTTTVVSIEECRAAQSYGQHHAYRVCVPHTVFKSTPDGKLLKLSPDNTLFAVNGQVSASTSIFDARNDQSLTVFRNLVVSNYVETLKQRAIDEHKTSGTPYVNQQCDVESSSEIKDNFISISRRFYAAANNNAKCYNEMAYAMTPEHQRHLIPNEYKALYAWKNIADLINEKRPEMNTALNQQINDYRAWRNAAQ